MSEGFKEVQDILEQTKELVKTLENKYNELKNNENKCVRWRAKEENGHFGDYYVLNVDGKVCRQTDTGIEHHADRYNIGNYFKTKEEAEKYKQNLIITQKLKDIALRLNDGVEIDWNIEETQFKYYIELYSDDLEQSYTQDYKQAGVVYCLSDKFLETAIKEIDEKELREYIKGC